MAQQLANGKQQFIDGNGAPLAGGSVAFYSPGTLTPVNTYQDSGLTTPNANPLTLDASGSAVIWGVDGTLYRQIVKDVLGNTIWDEVVGLALGNSVAFVVGSVSALAALNPSAYQVARTTGYYAGAYALNIGVDAGAGTYVYSSSTAQSSANGGTIIASTFAGATGCWLLLVDKEISITQFGADPTQTNDSTTAIQNAINAAIAAKCDAVCPAGAYLVSGLISASQPVCVRGAGKYVTVIQTNQANASIFSFSGQFFDLADMTLQGPSATTSGSLITCSCSSESIRNVRLSNYYTGITGSGNVGIYEGVDLNVAATTSSVGVKLTGYAGGLVIDKMIGYVPTVTPIAGIWVVACGALQITNSNIIKQGTNLLLQPGNGQTVASVMAVNTYFDSAQNFNVHIAPQAGGTVVRTYLTQCETSSSSGRGIVIDGSAGTVDGVCIISPQANLCASDGIYIAGANAKNIDIVGGQCGQNGGSGISIGASAQNVNVVGTRTGSGYGLTGNVDGIYIDSTCSGVKLTGVIAEGNSGAQIADGANSDIIGCVGASDTTYSNFGNGLVMQNGTFTSSATAGAAVAVTFPKPFQNGVIAVLPAANSASSTTAAAWFDTPTKTGFNGHCSAATTGVDYIAIGY